LAEERLTLESRSCRRDLPDREVSLADVAQLVEQLPCSRARRTRLSQKPSVFKGFSPSHVTETVHVRPFWEGEHARERAQAVFPSVSFGGTPGRAPPGANRTLACETGRCHFYSKIHFN
jgi:hypothetical protein